MFIVKFPTRQTNNEAVTSPYPAPSSITKLAHLASPNLRPPTRQLPPAGCHLQALPNPTPAPYSTFTPPATLLQAGVREARLSRTCTCCYRLDIGTPIRRTRVPRHPLLHRPVEPSPWEQKQRADQLWEGEGIYTWPQLPVGLSPVSFLSIKVVQASKSTNHK